MHQLYNTFQSWCSCNFAALIKPSDTERPFLWTTRVVLLQLLHEHAIILEKRVAVTYSIPSRAKDNEQMLFAYTLRSSSESSSSLNLASVDNETISISYHYIGKGLGRKMPVIEFEYWPEVNSIYCSER
ncbi:hypothetical protein KY285_035879 [Solanum tuberosum]|nr:hypothetical protein KY289_037868 [Solanum tuberosum]KAH0639293.1 hypothetical protein KY285_035879 [Solanum tuberosum]